MSGWQIDRRALVLPKIRQLASEGVADGTEFLLEHANRTAPIEEGTLIRSGTATSEDLRGVVAYDTPYAARQHEDTRLRHDSGRRAKWLELTLHEQGKTVLSHIAAQMKRGM